MKSEGMLVKEVGFVGPNEDTVHEPGYSWLGFFWNCIIIMFGFG